MTIRELGDYAAGQNRRRFEDYREAVSIAHLNASLVMVATHQPKKFPKLKDILPKAPVDRRRIQSDADRRAMLIRRFNLLLPAEQKVKVDANGKVLN
jgi:hypothetical protein